MKRLALASIAALALTGCSLTSSSGTTTSSKQVSSHGTSTTITTFSSTSSSGTPQPASKAPQTHPKPVSAPVAPQPTTTTPQTSTTAMVPAAPLGSKPGICQPYDILVNAETTSCPFAENVYDGYSPDEQTEVAYSPVTNQDYTLSCFVSSGAVVCTNGTGAYISFVWPQ